MEEEKVIVDETPPIVEQIEDKSVSDQIKQLEANLRTIQEKITFPKVDSYEFRGEIIKIRPLSYSASVKVRDSLKSARIAIDKVQSISTDERSKMTLEEGDKLDYDVAESVILVFEQLANFYNIKLELPIRDKYSVTEMLPFVEAQMGTQGEQDFLLIPLRHILHTIRLSIAFSP